MPYHDWSEDAFDWKGLHGAIDILAKWARRGLIMGQIKEKYGTARWYAYIGGLSLHTLIYPRYIYSQFPKWLWKLDIKYIKPVLQFFFEKAFRKYQMWAYNKGYQEAMKTYPHLRAEILCSADHLELIKGAARLDGKDLHVLGWNGEIISTWTSV